MLYSVVGRSLARIDLRWRLLVGVMLFVLPVMAVQAWTAADERSRAIDDARQQARAIALLAEANYSQVMIAGEAAINTLTASSIVHTRRGQACDEILRLFGDSHPAFSAFSVVDVDGRVTCSGQADLVGLSAADRSYFHDALRTGRIVSSGFLISRPSEIPIIVLAAPLTDPDAGVINGVLILSLELDWFSEVLGRLNLPEGSTLTVIGPTGDALVRLGTPPEGDVVGVSAHQNLRRTAASGGIDGQVAVSIPRGEVIAAATANMRKNILALGGAAGAFGIAAFALVTTTVQRPLNGLVTITQRIAAGDFDSRARSRPTDAPEVAQLAEAMNLSAQSLSQQEQRLLEMATVDILTGLPNRTGFVRLTDAQLEVDGEDDRPAMVGVVGMRAFSSINATFGFEVGDQVLQRIGSRIQSTLGSHATVARLGGDAFVFSVTARDGSRGPAEIAERLHQALGEPLPIEAATLRVRPYIGLSVFPAHGDEPEVLIRRAELASRRAREHARQWAEFDLERDETDSRVSQLLGDLQDALESSALEVHYQPKVHLATGRMWGGRGARAVAQPWRERATCALHPAGRARRHDPRGHPCGASARGVSTPGVG